MNVKIGLIAFLSFFFSFSENTSYAGNSTLEKAHELSEKIRDKKETLKNIHHELEENQRDFDNAEKQGISILDELQRIDQVKHAKKKELKLLVRETEQTVENSTLIGEKIDDTAEQLRLWKDSLRTRLRMHYKTGQLNKMTPLLASRGKDSGHLHDQVFSALSRLEHKKTQQADQELTSLEKRKQDYGRTTKMLIEKQTKVEATLHTIQTEQKKKRRLIARINKKQSVYEKTITELKASSAKIESLVNMLLKEQENFAQLSEIGDGLIGEKGALHWPSDGKVVAFFGRQKHPKFDTFLQRNGIDIKATQGTGIHSAFDGIVAFADWLKGYGLVLIIAHGLEDVSLYAHASSLLVNIGDRVKAGQLVGTVGDTGLTGNSMLYFEIRAGGKAVDPIKWLVARQ
tara:strand:- start:8738 stop:9940 length:1203 start_codon:yes stop_codon:yes gene_type:complete